MTEKKKSISLPLANAEETLTTEQDSVEESDDILSEIQRTVSAHPVLIFMKGIPEQPMCGFSARAAAILASYGRPFHAVNVLEDPVVRQGIKDYSNWPTIPQVYVKGEFLGGSDILMQMHQNGELAALIETAFED